MDKKYIGVTTVSSQEYRELIEEVAMFKTMHRNDNRQIAELEDELCKMTAECNQLRERLEKMEELTSLLDVYRNDNLELRKKLNAIEEAARG